MCVSSILKLHKNVRESAGNYEQILSLLKDLRERMMRSVINVGGCTRVSPLCGYTCVWMYTHLYESPLSSFQFPGTTPPMFALLYLPASRLLTKSPPPTVSHLHNDLQRAQLRTPMPNFGVHYIRRETARGEEGRERSQYSRVHASARRVTTSGLRPNTPVIQVMQCWFQYAVWAVRLPAFASCVSVRLF